jgi:Predicted ATPase
MIEFRDDININIKTRDLLKALSLSDQKINLDVKVPNSFFQTLLEQLLERDYLNDASDKIFIPETKNKRKIHWLQIMRLPIHPNENESYDLLSHWQGVLSSLHAWNYRLIFLLLRNEGQTKLYLGTVSYQQGISNEEAIEQIREAVFGSMPGMEMRTLSDSPNDVCDEIMSPLINMSSVGAVTGIPSFRDKKEKVSAQTLDQLAFGIRDMYGTEKDYAMLVIADPIPDQEISEIISRYRRLGSQIHTSVKMTAGQSLNRGETREKGAATKGAINSFVGILGAIAGSFLGAPLIGSRIGSTIGGSIGGAFGLSGQASVGGSASINNEYLDKFAEYAELATSHHIDRLNEGRNYGFWNTGVYVLGTSPRDVKTITGILRSIYSGDQSYFEPIRLHMLRPDSNALDIVWRFELIPMTAEDLPAPEKEKRKAGASKASDNEWHILGTRYQYLSTPINTMELGLATSLPRRDVPGLRFVKTAVRFANNPAVIKGEKIVLGNIVDTGIIQSNTYDIDVNSLVRHALVAGSTGSGKSTTCKRILSEVIGRDIPVLVIEPAKDDYVRWAVNMNKHLPEEKQFRIFMPGVEEFDGILTEPLYLNPFEPASVPSVKIDLLRHCENFSMLLNACLPSEEVVPILMEEVVDETIRDYAERNDRDYDDITVEPLSGYPDVDKMLDKAKTIMKNKSYASVNKDNLTEILVTRFNYLKRGMRGRILNVDKSTNYHELFSGNVIINISRLAGAKDKSLIMSLLMQALYEYRASRYAHDDRYRSEAQKNKLMHLTLVEEAHNVLLKPDIHTSSGSPQKAAADLFDTMLSEVREYGEGLVVVDQVPTRLIEGAIKNTNYKIVHRLTAPDDQEVMASCMAFRDDQKYIIPTLEKGNAIICGDEDDAAAWLKIPAPGENI